MSRGERRATSSAPPATSVQFFVAGVPVTQGSKTVYRGRVVEASKGLRRWRAAVASMATIEAWRWARPLHGPLAMTCAFRFPRPKRPANDYPPRDTDKLVRAIFDALKVGKLVVDDAQFVDLHATKRYADDSGERPPGVEITVALVTL